MGTYEHFMYGPSREALDAVAGDLTRAGYLVPDPPETGAGSCEEGECQGCDSHWILKAYGSAERAFAENGRDDIRQACADHAATYDGGGMFIGRIDQINPRLSHLYGQ